MMLLMELPQEILLHCLEYLVPQEIMVKYQPVRPVSGSEQRNLASVRYALRYCRKLTAMIRHLVYRETTFRFTGYDRATNLAFSN